MNENILSSQKLSLHCQNSGFQHLLQENKAYHLLMVLQNTKKRGEIFYFIQGTLLQTFFQSGMSKLRQHDSIE